MTQPYARKRSAPACAEGARAGSAEFLAGISGSARGGDAYLEADGKLSRVLVEQCEAQGAQARRAFNDGGLGAGGSARGGGLVLDGALTVEDSAVVRSSALGGGLSVRAPTQLRHVTSAGAQ